MKAMVRDRYGTPEVLQLREIDKPAPKAGEVRVRVRAASVNDWDWGLLQGGSFLDRMMSGLFRPKLKILGCDIAGVVDALGEGAGRFQVGEEVHGDLCASGFGAFAEYVCVPEARLGPKPAGMDFGQAAAIPQAGMLAVQGLIDAGRIGPGAELLLNGAGGGVGTFALQLAKLHGARVTAVDKAGKLERLRALGAHEVIDYAREDFTTRGQRYDLILDAQTTRSPFAYARALKPGGSYVTVGGHLGRLLQIFLLGPPLRALTGKRFRVVALKPNKDLAYLDGLFEAGQLAPVLDESYPLEELPAAFRRFGTGQHFGKIIVELD